MSEDNAIVLLAPRAARFKRPLLSVDVPVSVCVSLSATLMLNISEIKAIWGLVSNREPIGKCLLHVD